MSSMLVVGSVARDTIHNHLGTHPLVLGGSAVFGSLAGSFFAPVQLVGVVGNDFPDAMISLLRDRGIDMRGLEVVPGKTFFWEGRYSNDLSSRESLATELGVFASFHPKIPSEARKTPYLMLGNIDPELQVEVLDQMQSPKLVIADTMNFWISGKPKELAKMLARVDLLVINEEEARQLAGTQNILRAARELTAMGPKIVVIKRGEYGALLFEQGSMFAAPAFPVEEVVDPTGAGDTFAGGLLGYLAKCDAADSATLRRAVIHGSVMASFCVEGMSVDRLTGVRANEIAERYRAFAQLAHFASENEMRAL